MTFTAISLTNGGFTFVSPEDVGLVSQYRWTCFEPSKSHRYARTYVNGRYVYLHRFLTGAKGRSTIVDHKDRNTLNNCRENLRICTYADNARNRIRKRGKSGYIGVFKQADGYVVRIKSKDKDSYVGYFQSKHVAALAYNDAIKAAYGEFAILNEIDNSMLLSDIEVMRSEACARLAEIESLHQRVANMCAALSSSPTYGPSHRSQAKCLSASCTANAGSRATLSSEVA